MLKMLVHWLTAAVAIAIAAYLVPGVSVTFAGTLIAAVVLSALNFFIRPIVTVLTLPINVVTLGLFSLVINAALVLLASYLVPGFSVPDFWAAFLFAMVLAIVNWVFNLWQSE